MVKNKPHRSAVRMEKLDTLGSELQVTDRRKSRKNREILPFSSIAASAAETAAARRGGQ
jgi:hypothetical protein